MRRPFTFRTHISAPVVIFLVAIALWLALISPAAADGIIVPQPPRDRPISWREIPLAVKYHRVEVTIKDQVATTHVDQVFVNEAAFPVEGTYLFPLPEDAAISSFDMWVDGQKLEGKLLGREEARAIYEEIVRKQRDPALLEYVGRGAFQARIFPIPPRGERRIELTYTQVLPQKDGLVHYRYPLNTEKFSARPIGEVAITVRLEDKAPLRAIYSPSHPVVVMRDGDRRATASYEARNVRPDRDFDLYTSVSNEALAANLLSYKPFDADGFFLLLVTPPIKPRASDIVDKDVILVFDTSGSMDGEKVVQAKAAATYVLDHLGEGDRFNIVSFNTSTDINRALLEAVAGADKERPTVVIFMTDGLPTVGEKNPDRIVANVTASAPKSVRLFAFGVGSDVDTVLLDQLSSSLRGTSAYVRPGQKIDEEVSGFYAKVSSPVLTDVKLDVQGARIEELYPYPLPDLFAGNQLVIAGRYRQGGPATIRLSGQVNGQPQSYTYNAMFAARGGDDFIARLWAQRKIGYLLAQIRLSGAKDELVKEIVALSTRYGIVTPYTSFLVQEPQLALTQGGRDQLSRSAVAPAPTSRAGGSPAAPAGPLAAAERSGEKAVDRAVVESQLKTSEQAAAPSVQQLRQVGDKTFLFSGNTWLDTAFDASKMQAEAIVFGSDRYFQLLGQDPEIGRYLALGDRVTVILNGKAYAIGGEGQTAAQPAAQPGPAASPSPVPTRAAAKIAPQPTPIPQLQTEGTPIVAGQPNDTPVTDTVVTEGQAAPPVCAGTGMIGLLGLLLPVWVWCRRGI
ncbi:MAG: VWA domain-containing protein [Anaerolineae bacterium]|nr:VWA domain-containing protein [Anaerolineae bacterium]